MPSPEARRARNHAALIAAGWPLALLIVGVGDVLIGALTLLDGAKGLALPAFHTSTLVPWWVWGSWAAAAGLLVAVPRPPVRLVGLVAMTTWYALWWALLTIGILHAGPPHRGIATYALLLAGHALMLVVEGMPWWDEWRSARTSRRATGTVQRLGRG